MSAKIRGKEATITLLVDGVPLRSAPASNVSSEREETYDVNGFAWSGGFSWSIEFACEDDGVFHALWYDIADLPAALGRWADDGGAVAP